MSGALTVERYSAALRDHLRRDGDERSLLSAYELGRHLMERGAGLLDVVRLHNAALDEIAQQDSGQLAPYAPAASFLAEVLAPFEMAFLGFQEANASLRQLTDSLEEQVAERTTELQHSLSILEAAEAERRRLLRRVVAAEEQERHRIADDVHDDTIQAVTAAGLRLSALRGRLDSADHPVLDRIEHTVADAVGRLRRLVFELRPPALDGQGICAALRELLTLTMEDGPSCSLHDQLDEEPPLRIAEIAYRVAQEALANVRKHADASRVDVTVTRENGGVRVTITDDGRGFDPRELERPRPGHLGTTTMRERAALVDGWCTIDSSPGRGTTVAAWIPTEPGTSS